MNKPVYKILDIKKKRTKGGVSFTLHIPELVINRGEFVSVVGPSGCGKSTLLDILALVLQPSSASCFTMNVSLENTFQDYDISSLSENNAARIRRRGIGYVLQNGGLLPFLSVRENIMIPAQLNGMQITPQAFDSLIAVLGLKDQLPKKPQHLSGGQRQRVAVARALIHKPTIILADEPTAAVDYPTAIDVRDELRNLAHEAGSAVVMITHDYSLVKNISDVEVQFKLTRTGLDETLATTSIIRHI